VRRIAAAALSALLAGGVTADAHAQERSGGSPDAAGRPRPGMERLARAIERGLALDEAQGARLRELSARYAERRQALVADERAARRTLREELSRGDAADQRRVAAALTSLLDAQRRRVALVDSEQRELAAFLTPVQRARFLALQERALRAAQRARLRREAGGPGGPRHGAGPYR
jgi:Spy/CpxP family protein refolding chaperone